MIVKNYVLQQIITNAEKMCVIIAVKLFNLANPWLHDNKLSIIPK
jgi:hypothetical protein